MGTLKSSDLRIKSEEMFTKSDFGKPIGEELSTILRRNLNKDNLANIAAGCGISYSTVRDLVYRTNSLTEGNSMALALLIHAALENSVARRLQSEGDIMFLDALLKH
ncbi:hypothetical protein [Flagellimonas algicola]|uniref:Cro/C1-type helix-turn-helix DNA-binding protein n=1 Tax=Flagellimonas algicola TaxID=2583815 RepID=A0ABY2WJH2_9FLAO|nr:hypothetical protein [Allomuricauda algicola]TMU54987.1 hypothetical protein FGG15_12405 [Allomuricauda algicola]